MKIGCCVSMKNIILAKDIGYAFVELSAQEIMAIKQKDWPTIRRYILDSNIPVIGFNSFCDDKNPIVGPAVNFDTLISYLDIVIARANDLHCHNIGIGAPKARIIPADFSYNHAINQMKQFLKVAATMAAKYNINILYEALHPKCCNFGNSSIEIYTTIKEINMPNLKMVWDVYHSIVANEKYDDIKTHFDKVEHVHICSWDAKLQRYYPGIKDQKYMDELCNYLTLQKYNKTISIEAPDTDFKYLGRQTYDMIISTIH